MGESERWRLLFATIGRSRWLGDRGDEQEGPNCADGETAPKLEPPVSLSPPLVPVPTVPAEPGERWMKNMRFSFFLLGETDDDFDFRFVSIGAALDVLDAGFIGDMDFARSTSSVKSVVDFSRTLASSSSMGGCKVIGSAGEPGPEDDGLLRSVPRLPTRDGTGVGSTKRSWNAGPAPVCGVVEVDVELEAVSR